VTSGARHDAPGFALVWHDLPALPALDAAVMDKGYPYNATYSPTFTMSCQGLTSTLCFAPFTMREIGRVIAPLGPLHQAQDVFHREGF
jgi:hypothetical protein